MRAALVSVFVFLAIVSVSNAQRGLPLHPGVSNTNRLRDPANIPPQNRPIRKSSDPEVMRTRAQVLQKLADSIPPDIDQAIGGKLAKDLPARLKQIEKLSKQLRQQLSP